ncbi:hypothetical protein OZ411_28755 [Bradyrhizobium sp. Arg237L]|uniref:hypothetical protein n=1 Tax=Bradyrhizobium sp. Arg237L TaxID=3003352 RepID=UPI00249D9083|nr:hypothetical protein [Bradyrhizobium sp. Arg237L]MDI4236808.1 hypothetical protein [Bradyrhizobium sp. Arg237L]
MLLTPIHGRDAEHTLIVANDLTLAFAAATSASEVIDLSNTLPDPDDVIRAINAIIRALGERMYNVHRVLVLPQPFGAEATTFRRAAMILARTLGAQLGFIKQIVADGTGEQALAIAKAARHADKLLEMIGASFEIIGPVDVLLSDKIKRHRVAKLADTASRIACNNLTRHRDADLTLFELLESNQ